MDVQTLAPVALLALPFVVCIIIVLHLYSAYLDSRAQKRKACQRAQQEHQERLTLERVRQALVQREVELRLLATLADLYRLKEVIASKKCGLDFLFESLKPVEERLLAQEQCICMLYAMALDHRVTLQEVSRVEAEIHSLWSRYYSGR